MSSSFQKYRSLYNSLIYKEWKTKKVENDLVVEFVFELTSRSTHSIIFKPHIVLKELADSFYALPKQEQESLAFHLGMAELPTYWKTTCAATIQIDAKPDNTLITDINKDNTFKMMRWWHRLLIFGMSEFYFVNNIDSFKENGFITWKIATHTNTSKAEYIVYTGESLQKLKTHKPPSFSCSLLDTEAVKPLIPVGGGKDSAVTLNYFSENTTKDTQNKASNKKISDSLVLLLNPIPAAANIVAQFEFPTVTVTRKIDPQVLKLNAKGYLNGHTPFSAYLAFLSYAVAHITQRNHIVLSNERSANEGNTVFHGLPINHQYSKSFDFEQTFGNYSSTYLPGNIVYYSILRPLYELQIGKLFIHTTQKKPPVAGNFISCNVKGRENKWCGMCPKCLFSYTLLYPHFLEASKAVQSPLFDLHLFSDTKQIPILRDLLGMGKHKPLECVGLYQETLLSLWKSLTLLTPQHSLPNQIGIPKKHTQQKPSAVLDLANAPVLQWFQTEVIPSKNQRKLAQDWKDMLSDWNTQHLIPQEIEKSFMQWVQSQL